ncbi:hypothetical protein BJ741DRAFT_329136 [Chytriomyces cf. hyalinus JEL632]|nr:hypothetical protein BJ741DRAFT_329136 [Chytriomyces cf. hyalinus JEL632]
MRLDKIAILAALSFAPQPADATFGLLKEVATHIFGGIFGGGSHHNQLPAEVPQVVPPTPPPVVINNVQNTVQTTTTTTIINQVPQTVINQIVNVFPQPVPMIQQIIIQMNGLVVLDGGSWTDAVQTFCSQFSTTNQIQLQPVQVVTIAQQVLPCFPVGDPSHAVFQTICNLKFPDPNQAITVQQPPTAAAAVTINNSLDPVFTDQGLSIAGSIIPMTTISTACQQFNIQQPVFTNLIQSCTRLSIPATGDWDSAIQGIATTAGISPTAVVQIGGMVLPCFAKGTPAYSNFQSICDFKVSGGAADSSLAVVGNAAANHVPDYQPPVVAYQPPAVVTPSYQAPVAAVPVQQTYQAPDVQNVIQQQVVQPPVVQQVVVQQQQVAQPQIIQQVAPQVQVQQPQVYQQLPQVYQQEQQVTPPAVDVVQDVYQQQQQVQVVAPQVDVQPQVYQEQQQHVQVQPQVFEQQQIIPPQVAQVPIVQQSIQLTPQVVQILPVMVTCLGLPVGTGNACLQTVIRTCGSSFTVGINRAMNPSQEDIQMKLVTMVNALSAQNKTLANADSKQYTDAAVLLAREYSVTPAFVSRMATGVVSAFQAQNQTSGDVYRTFEGVARIVADAVGTETAVATTTVAGTMSVTTRVSATSAMNSQTSFAAHMVPLPGNLASNGATAAAALASAGFVFALLF